MVKIVENPKKRTRGQQDMTYEVSPLSQFGGNFLGSLIFKRNGRCLNKMDTKENIFDNNSQVLHRALIKKC